MIPISVLDEVLRQDNKPKTDFLAGLEPPALTPSLAPVEQQGQGIERYPFFLAEDKTPEYLMAVPESPEAARMKQELLKTPEQRAQEKYQQYLKDVYGIEPGKKPTRWQSFKVKLGEFLRALGQEYAKPGSYVPPIEQARQQALEEYRAIAPVMQRELTAEETNRIRQAAQNALNYYRQQQLGLQQQRIDLQRMQTNLRMAQEAFDEYFKQNFIAPLMQGRAKLAEVQAALAHLRPEQLTPEQLAAAYATRVDPKTGQRTIDLPTYMDVYRRLLELQSTYRLSLSMLTPSYWISKTERKLFDPNTMQVKTVEGVNVVDRRNPAGGVMSIFEPEEISPNAIEISKQDEKPISELKNAHTQVSVQTNNLALAKINGTIRNFLGINSSQLFTDLRRAFELPKAIGIEEAINAIAGRNSIMMHMRNLYGGRAAQQIINDMKAALGGRGITSDDSLLALTLAHKIMLEIAILSKAGYLTSQAAADPLLSEELTNSVIDYIQKVKNASAVARQTGTINPFAVPEPPSMQQIIERYQRKKRAKQELELIETEIKRREAVRKQAQPETKKK